MGRRIVVAVFAVLAVVLTTAAPGVSAACPNEAFRIGPSAALPECRAYEQVTPVDKESGIAISDDGGARVAPSGEGIFFFSRSAYAGQRGNIIANPYLSTRSGESWMTKGIGGVQANEISTSYIASFGASRDLTYSLVASKEGLGPGAVPGGSNLYIRDNLTDTYTTVVARPGGQLFAQFTNTGQAAPVLAGASPDWGTVFLEAESPFRAEDEFTGGALYEFRDGKLDFITDRAFAAAQSELVLNVASDDGRRLYYVREGKLYLHELGNEPAAIDEDDEGEPVGVFEYPLLGATPDGGIAVFKGFSPLGSGIYRFEASAPVGEQVTVLTPPIGPSRQSAQVDTAFAGGSGTFAYFTSPEQLTSDAEPLPGGNGTDIYVWHGEPGQTGEIRYIGQSDFQGIGPGRGSVSPDGRTFAFEAVGAVTPDASDGPNCQREGAPGCTDVFVYSFDADRMSCVSCAGGPADGSSRLGAVGTRVQGAYTVARPVLDDGSVFFDSPNAIAPGDVNGALDAYGWIDGAPRLISTGTDPGPSVFVGASPDGSDVFFRTTQGLVGQDLDSMTDLYDARIDGGLPQAGPPITSQCILGNACRSGVEPGSTPQTPASNDLRGLGNLPPACSALRQRARAAKARSRVLARRADQAATKKAKALRKKAQGAASTARRLGRRAGSCTGGGR